MSSLNQVNLIGNLGADPETRYTNSGTAVTSIRIATSERWTDKQTGEKQERTEWHSITFWGKLAEIAGEYLSKGSKVFVSGQLRTEEWTDKEGVKRYTTKINATQLVMLSSKQDGGGQQDRGDRGGQRSGGQQYGQGRQQGGQSQRQPPPDQGFADDEIPF